MKRTFTNSELSCYQDCPQKWWFKYHEKLSPKREKSALSFGKLIHEALDIMYDYQHDDQALEYFNGKINQEIKDNQENLEELTGLKNMGISILSSYFQFAKQNDDFEIIESEREYLVPIIAPSGRQSTAFDYSFRPDQLTKRNNQIWIHEFKTAKQIGSDYLANLILDEQMSRYIWGTEKAKVEKVAGVIYTILRKKIPAVPKILKTGGLSKVTSIDTNYDTYLKAINDNNLDPKDYQEILDLLKAKGNTFIQREVVLRNEKEKKACEGRLWTLCKTINTDPPIYKCPSRDCGWKCDFRNLCIEDTPEARSTYIARENYHPEINKEEVNNGNDNKF